MVADAMRVRGSRKAGMFRKPKEISEYDRPIEDWESPDDEGRFGRAKDECGTMKDELKERRKPEEGVRGRQEEQVRFGTRAGMSQRTKEMPVYDRPIKLLQYHRTNGVEAAGRNWDSRLETSDRRPSPGTRRTGPRARWNFRFGRTTHPNKPNRFKFW
jgi:hypothetical protein